MTHVTTYVFDRETQRDALLKRMLIYSSWPIHMVRDSCHDICIRQRDAARCAAETYFNRHGRFIVSGLHMCCSVLQSVASVLQCVVVCGRMFQHVAVCSRVMQRGAA